MINAKERIIQVFINNGVSVFDDDDILDMDSLVYLSVIVQIEEEFCVEIPDTYLISDKLTCVSDFVTLVESII